MGEIQTTPIGETLLSSNLIPPSTVTFHGSDGEVVGELDFSDGTLRFEGDADASAQSFINYLKMYWEK